MSDSIKQLHPDLARLAKLAEMPHDQRLDAVIKAYIAVLSISRRSLTGEQFEESLCEMQRLAAATSRDLGGGLEKVLLPSRPSQTGPSTSLQTRLTRQENTVLIRLLHLTTPSAPRQAAVVPSRFRELLKRVPAGVYAGSCCKDTSFLAGGPPESGEKPIARRNIQLAMKSLEEEHRVLVPYAVKERQGCYLVFRDSLSTPDFEAFRSLISDEVLSFLQRPAIRSAPSVGSQSREQAVDQQLT
jgi:hypothetical protein